MNQVGVALVTGASRGIGRACAFELARLGFHVVLVSRTIADLERVGAELTERGASHAILPADVTDEEQVARVFAEVAASSGALTCLVNNAGAFASSPLAETEAAHWDHVFAVNVRAAFLCARAAFRVFLRTGGGSIVNVASRAGLSGSPKVANSSAYVASKAALVGLTEALAVEGRAHGIRVNCVAPGAVDTQMLRAAAPHVRTNLSPEAIAQTIGHLCDVRASGHLNGTIVNIPSDLAAREMLTPSG